MHMCSILYMLTHKYIYTYKKDKDVYVYTTVYMYVHMFICMYIYTYIYTCRYMCLYMYTYMFMETAPVTGLAFVYML